MGSVFFCKVKGKTLFPDFQNYGRSDEGKQTIFFGGGALWSSNCSAAGSLHYICL